MIKRANDQFAHGRNEKRLEVKKLEAKRRNEGIDEKLERIRGNNGPHLFCPLHPRGRCRCRLEYILGSSSIVDVASEFFARMLVL